MRKKHNVKLPNGFGSIQKLSGNRRKPWRVRKTKGWEIVGPEQGTVKQTYINVGTFETYQEALAALVKYNENPYDLAADSMTFEDVMDKWHDMAERKFSQGTCANYFYALRRLPTSFKKAKIKKIRTSDIENALLDAAETKYAIRNALIAIKHVFDHALKHDLCEKNVAELVDIDPLIKKDTQKITRKPLSSQEIDAVLESSDSAMAIIRVGIFTGMRPTELLTLRRDHVDITNWTICHGIKTAAGKGRIIPIHKDIRPLFKSLILEKKEYLFDNGTRRLKYHQLRYLVQKTLPGHTPHDLRHTFITQWRSVLNLDEQIGYAIFGHSTGHVSEDVYTHRSIDQLASEMDRFHYSTGEIALFKTS